MPCKAEASRPSPQTEPRKGRGRYAQVSYVSHRHVLPCCVTFSAPRSGVGTINSRFSIRKDRNNGMDFQYDAVVRNRQERKHMLGGDCECCHEVSGNNPSDDRLHAESPLTSTMRPLVHYRLHDSRSGGRQQSTKHPTTTLHRTTRRMTTK